MTATEPGVRYRRLARRARVKRAASRLLAPGLLLLLGLARRSVWRRARVVTVIGSFGKTTTTHAVTAALGLPLTWWSETGRNAYSSLPLNTLWQLARYGEAVVEVGIGSPGQMGRYASALRPDIVVLTGLGSDHLPSFRDRSHLWAEKARMLAALRDGGVVLVNADDQNAVEHAARASSRILGFGFGAGAEVRGVGWRAEPGPASVLSVSVDGRRLEIRSRLPTRTSCRALLAGLAAALVSERDLDPAATDMAAVASVRGRLEPRPLPNGAVALNDTYKGTFETVVAALTDFVELPARRRLLLLGELETPPDGRRSYREVGRLLASGIDRIFLVGVGTTRLSVYRAAARRAGLDADRVEAVADVQDAIERLRPELSAGDLLLVKGRSSQRLERVIKGLAGVEVSCRLRTCGLDVQRCKDCPLL
ncbi:MAG TPA: Mur ligase family protein [Thermoanaerobaculia bacterium]|nr:Mur ligase family protein [Thermoanaerobaculia bacterium]